MCEGGASDDVEVKTLCSGEAVNRVRLGTKQH